MAVQYASLEAGGFVAACILLGAGLGILWRLIR